MSKLSIYESSWLNIVFEGRNKEYGAYQLRKESSETTWLAFCLSLFFIASLATIPAILKSFSDIEKTPIGIPEAIDKIVKISNLYPIEPKKPLKLIVPIHKKATKEIKKDELKKVEIVKPIDVNNNVAKNNEHSITITDDTKGNVTDGLPTVATPSKGTETSIPIDSGTIINTTTSLDKLPEFPGGIKKFIAFVGNNFEKPEIEEVKTLKVYVYFVIEKDGSMTDIQVRRDPGYGLGKEAVRVLKSLKTKWEPGFIAGKPVRTAYNLPIIVNMQ
jgi:periplasmic protein TonB